ncbi:TPA: Ldh family oxidoreductase [Enterobacter hormaechei subsp. steigerwaltii]|nr:Ldh family oxidoreductase [Enterobacter hormaechei subsp. steigerwaltii]HBC0022760.1 Ldh family oxidoreductase [Enterobacter hormaechei subsp. steigerwaltii]
MNNLIAPSALKRFVSAVYQQAGVPDKDADIIADTLVQADLWGHQSHGVLRLSWYLERLRSGVMTAVTQSEHVVDTPCVSVIDGKDGIGQVLATQGMLEAIAKAKKCGTATVAIRNSNHFGTVMYYTRMAAEAGCVAFMTCNGGPAMAPWGGYRDKIIGTNPWSLAAPAGDKAPLMLDIANTGVARGKIYLARNRNEKIPEGWALNASGENTTDPTEAINGIILPMAGHKGYAIGVMMDIFAGVLSGSQFLSGVNGPYHYDKKSGVGHFISVYDIATFMPLDQYNERISSFISQLKEPPVAAGHEGIFYPGELEARNAARNIEAGLSLAEGTLQDLERIAEECGLKSILPEFSIAQ